MSAPPWHWPLCPAPDHAHPPEPLAELPVPLPEASATLCLSCSCKVIRRGEIGQVKFAPSERIISSPGLTLPPSPLLTSPTSRPEGSLPRADPRGRQGPVHVPTVLSAWCPVPRGVFGGSRGTSVKLCGADSPWSAPASLPVSGRFRLEPGLQVGLHDAGAETGSAGEPRGPHQVSAARRGRPPAARPGPGPRPLVWPGVCRH